MKTPTALPPSGTAQAAGNAVADAIAQNDATIQQAADDAAEARRIAQEALDAAPNDATIEQRIGELEESIAEWHDLADDLQNEIQALEIVQSRLSQQMAELTQRIATMQTPKPPAEPTPEPKPGHEPPSPGNTPGDQPKPLDQNSPPVTPEPSIPIPPKEGAGALPGAERKHRLI